MITLTTDFGTDDPFAGIMKGVIRSIHPTVEIKIGRASCRERV